MGPWLIILFLRQTAHILRTIQKRNKKTRNRPVCRKYTIQKFCPGCRSLISKFTLVYAITETLKPTRPVLVVFQSWNITQIFVRWNCRYLSEKFAPFCTISLLLVMGHRNSSHSKWLFTCSLSPHFVSDGSIEFSWNRNRSAFLSDFHFPPCLSWRSTTDQAKEEYEGDHCKENYHKVVSVWRYS